VSDSEVAAGHDTDHEVPELRGDGLVQTEVLPDDSEVLRRAVLAAGEGGEVLGDCVEQEERERGDQEHDHDRADRPADEELKHGGRLLSSEAAVR
jgi:hypothetical protein